MKDYYEILGVDSDADEAAIKKAYRELARRYHPDLNPDDPNAEERFKDISEAYAVLSDPERRAEYDKARAYGAAGVGAGADFGGFQVNFEDLFGGGGPEDLFEQIFGGGRRRGGRPRGRRGADLETSITIPFDLAIRGGRYEVRLPVHGADGPQVRTVTVTIPPGVQDGQRLRLRGQGEPGTNGGRPGDLYLRIHVAPHPWLRREGDNVLLKLPISLHEALAGAQVDVPTVDGTSTLKIPPGSQSGQKLRMRGKGVRRPGAPGDQLVELQIMLPTDQAGREALERALASVPPYNPRKF